ncbi:DUF499 domain-containing protein [Stygiolobus caldivivus]|uniref:DUF499 domain-containing protein n=1 Tax=Stygiolobus caldivivus TaxID=2824673 RepID=A0A8D5ZIY8_9CREN|nr:DUF499 domain-containing protein [Stygiolobus caldivivus]BCU70066.1 hypothetical protein KN1_13630 [Stygiolobus caldivivus]
MADLSLYQNVIPREDVFNPKFDDEVAPELSDVHKGTAPSIYTNPEEFFAITYFTDSMRNLVRDISESFRVGKGMTIPLYSFFGGGKTHSLIMLYHAFKNPDIAKKYNLDVESGVKVIVVGGKDSATAPSPDTPSDVKTLWGYIAKQLGKYDIIAKADNDLMAPQKDVLEKVFEGEKVLILFDEIVWYLSRVKDTIYNRYYTQCLLFFENLASVTANLPVVIVVTIPGKYYEKTGVVQAEKSYENVVEELSRKIERIGRVYRAPIETPVDLGKVLKKRLFKSINEEIIPLVKSKYSKYLEDFKDYVDQESIENFDDAYPFHPYYLELLKLLLEETGLQGTRDGIRLSRMVVRLLWNDKPKRSLILPSDIDIRNEQFKVLLLKNYTDFDKVVDSIKNVTKGLSIYFSMANYIFLSTYMFKLGLDPGQLRNALPDSKKVVTSVLDPLYLEDISLTPAEVKTKLADMTSGGKNVDKIVPYLIYSEDKYWFTSFLDPITICKRGKSKVLDADAVTVIKDMIGNLAETPIDAIEKRSKKEVYKGIIKKFHIVDSIEHLVDVDEETYNLVILWKPLCDGCSSQDVKESDYYDEIKRFIYNVPSGKSSISPRKNANSLALMFSLTGNGKEKLIEQTKEYISCRDTDVSKYYSDEVSKNIAKKMLTDFLSRVQNSIYNQIFNYYDRVAYPDKMNDVQIVTLSTTGKTLLENAEETMRNENKIIRENDMDFDTLAYYLEQTNINIRDTTISYPQLRQMFYTNPMLPWASDEALKSAIVSGLKSYSIGVLSGSKIYFKAEEGSTVEYSNSLIDNSTTVLPARVAADKQIDSLLEQEKEFEEDGKIHKTYYVVATDEEEIPLKELRDRENWFDIFINGKLRKKEEVIESGVDIELEPRVIKAKAGDTVSVKIRVSKVGKFDKEVYLEASKGSLSQTSGAPPFDAILTASVEDGQPIVVTAKYDNKTVKAQIPVELVQVVEQCEKVLDPRDSTSPVIFKVDITDMKNILSILDQLRVVPGVKFVEGEVTVEDPSRVSVLIRPKDMKLNEFIEFLNRQTVLIGLTKYTISGKVTVKVNDPKPLDEKDKKKIIDLISKNAIIAWTKVC